MGYNRLMVTENLKKEDINFSLQCIRIIMITCYVEILTANMSSVFLSPVKSNAILLQAWTGPEVSRRLRFPDFKTIGI